MFERGNKSAPILVLLSPPSINLVGRQMVLSNENLLLFSQIVAKYGFSGDDFAFMNVCPHMDNITFSSVSRQTKFLKEHRDEFLRRLSQYSPRVIMSLGALPTRQITNKATKITEVRGQAFNLENVDVPVFFSLDLGFVQRSPQNASTFETDIRSLRKFLDSGCDINANILENSEWDYQWVDNLDDWMRDRPKIMSHDTETTGLNRALESVFPFTFQFCREPGKAVIFPVHPDYYPEFKRDHNKLIFQAKSLLEDPDVLKIGHNMKYDFHMYKKVGIHMRGWKYDTMLMAAMADENMQRKNLDECVKRWVPEMAGYADIFNREIDKSDMWNVPHNRIRVYGCGDVDGSYRLAKQLQSELVQDPAHFKVYHKIQLPALVAIAETLETNGVDIDTTKLGELGTTLAIEESTLYSELILHTPPAVKRSHLEAKKELAFSRDAFVRDIMFSKDGFNQTPVQWTDSTRMLSAKERVPSVSTKKHLPYFKDFTTEGLGKYKDKGFKYVEKLTEYQKIEKLRTTYVGQAHIPATEEAPEQLPTGFWQYIIDGGRIYPTYNIHATNTLRTNSSDPNAQNFPKRGANAKLFRKTFVSQNGWTLIQVDLSQAELRFTAIAANEQRMLEAYRNGEDLHSLTASALMGLSLEEFLKLPEEQIELYRYRAKSCNFGLIYGMRAKGFREYAYTDYGLELTLEEAEEYRNRFFALYPDLEAWHKKCTRLVKRDKCIRGPLGRVRHLPDIDSKEFTNQSLAERQAINAPIQGVASDWGLWALARMHRDMEKWGEEIPMKPLMFIHDALVIAIRNDYLEKGMSAAKFYMESNPSEAMFGLKLPIPILADVEAGLNLGELKKQKHVVSIAPEWYTAA